MEKRISRLDRLKAALKEDTPITPTMTKAQGDKLYPVMTAIVFKARIGAAYKGFHESNNPLYLLEGFVAAHRAGKPTPDWIMDALVPAFERVLKGRGAVTLNAALGFIRKHGQRNWWSELRQRCKDDRLKWLIEERPRVVDQLLEVETHPVVRSWIEPLKTKPKVSGKGGAAEQALTVLHPQGDPTGAKQDSLIQRYGKKIKPRS